MRWLCGRMVGLGVLIFLVGGCGSTSGDDSLVFHFLRFDNTGITQSDAVGQTSADVDIAQELCGSGVTSRPEPFTQTVINAVFRNEAFSDLHLEQIVIDVGPTSGRAPMIRQLGGDIPGGQCSNITQQCGTDADCLGVAGACSHTETTITGILLFDFDDKAHIIPGTYNVSITFFASDPNHTYRTSTSYVVRFDDFNNCPAGSGGAAS